MPGKSSPGDVPRPADESLGPRLSLYSSASGARWQSEYDRMLPERVQRAMTMFELSVYSPTIEETWKDSGISRLKVDAIPDQRWQEPLEAVVYIAGKYLS
jgi:hypothetical protein